MTAAAVLLQEIAAADFALSRFTMQAAGIAGGAASVPRIAGVEPAFGAHANPPTESMCEQMCSQLVDVHLSQRSAARRRIALIRTGLHGFAPSRAMPCAWRVVPAPLDLMMKGPA